MILLQLKKQAHKNLGVYKIHRFVQNDEQFAGKTCGNFA